MKFLAIFLVIIFALTKAEVEVDDDGVLVLTDDTFDEAIKANDVLLVEVSIYYFI